MANNQSIIEILEDKIRQNISGYSEEVQAVFNTCDYGKSIEKAFLKIYKIETVINDSSLEDFIYDYYEKLTSFKNLEWTFLTYDLRTKINEILAEEQAAENKKNFQRSLDTTTGHTDSTTTEVMNLGVANYLSTIKPMYDKIIRFASDIYLEFNDMAWSELPERSLTVVTLMDYKSSLKNIIIKLNKLWWDYGHSDALAIKAKARLTEITTRLEKDISEIDRLCFTAHAVYRNEDNRDELISTLLDLRLPVSKLALAEAAVNDKTIDDEKMKELLYGNKPELKLLDNKKRA